MAYIPTEWKDGDIITAEKLNNLENGVANEKIFYFSMNRDESLNKWVIDVSFSDLEAAWRANKTLICCHRYHNGIAHPYETQYGIDYFYIAKIEFFYEENATVAISNYIISSDGVVNSIMKQINFNTN